MSNLSITEMSQKYSIKADTIRYYERIGLLPDVPRLKNGNRYFEEGMQGWMEMIVCLRHSGMPIETLHDYATMVRQGDDTLSARKELLEEQEKELLNKQKDIQRSIDRLHHKISLYDTGEIKEQKSYFEEYKIADDLI
ncbi:MerR family transcriptional regulator [Dellaglioa sp. BT-FLS60]